MRVGMVGMRPLAGYAGPVTTEDPTAERPATPGRESSVPGTTAHSAHAGPPIHAGHPAHAGPPTHAGPAAALGSAAPTAPLDVPTRTIVVVGTAVWALALVVTLVVPSLHTGERSWWPWACVTGMALGAFAWWYVGRGAGDARRNV